jgi:hypothetical protein
MEFCFDLAQRLGGASTQRWAHDAGYLGLLRI